MTRRWRNITRATLMTLLILSMAILGPAALAAPPAPTILTPQPNATLNGVPVTATGSTEPNHFVSVFEGSVVIGGDFANGSGNWSMTLDIGGGSHTIRAYALGPDLTESPASGAVTFTVDAAPIAPRFTSPVQDARTNQTSIMFTGHTDNGTTVTLKEGSTTLASGIAVSDRTFTTTLTFAAGTHTVTGTATDGQGRTSTAGSVRFTVDLTPPPAPAISSPAQGAAFSSGTVTVSGSAEAKSTVTLYEDSTEIGVVQASASGGWSIPLSGLAAGSHSVTARATDVAGNAGPSSAVRTFVVDQTGPEVAISTPNDQIFLTPAAIVGTAADNYRVARIQLTYRNLAGTVVRTVNNASCTGCSTPSANWSDAPGLGTGAYTVTAISYDSAGNTSSPGSITFVQV
jgi:hypothetical protein